MDELEAPAVSVPPSGMDTTSFPLVTRPPAPALWDEAELAGILLPTERVAFGSRPHPIVMLKPALVVAVGLLAAQIIATLHVHPIVRGHHVDIALLRTEGGILAMGITALAVLFGTFDLIGRVLYYFSYRVVVTNRRVFVVQGILGRGLRPLGNTPIMRSALSQTFFGRLWNYGTVVTPWGRMRSMREPIPLYRALQVVANGIQGDEWAQAQRTTIVP